VPMKFLAGVDCERKWHLCKKGRL